MSEQYKFNEIPKNFETTIYTHYCYHSDYSWDLGKVTHDTYDRSGDNRICIAQTKVNIEVPEQKANIKELVLQALETEKKNQMAEHHKRMFELQEKIDGLLCLEYTPTDSFVDDDVLNEVPF